MVRAWADVTPARAAAALPPLVGACERAIRCFQPLCPAEPLWMEMARVATQTSAGRQHQNLAVPMPTDWTTRRRSPSPWATPSGSHAWRPVWKMLRVMRLSVQPQLPRVDGWVPRGARAFQPLLPWLRLLPVVVVVAVMVTQGQLLVAHAPGALAGRAGRSAWRNQAQLLARRLRRAAPRGPAKQFDGQTVQ